MAGRVRYLVRRGHGFQVRFPIPKELQSVFGRKELRWSLRTSDPKQARDKALRATLTFHDLCASVARMGDLSEAKVRELVRAFFEQLKNQYVPPKGLPAGHGHGDDERQAWVVEDLMVDLKVRAQNNEPDGKSVEHARRLAGVAGVDFDELTPARQHQLVHGVLRARIEELEHWLFRRKDPVGPYAPVDPLFQAEIAYEVDVQSIAKSKNHTQLKESFENGYKVGELVNEYIDTGKSVGIEGQKWSEKTATDYEASLHWFMKAVGADLPVGDLKTAHINNFRNGLLRMRTGASKDLSFSDAQTQDQKTRISVKTAWKRFATVKSFLKWLYANEYSASQIGAHLKIAVPTQAGSEKRRSFDSTEIEKLFSSPLYAGHKSKKDRHKAGAVRPKDGLFWAFLLLMYTGARLNEVIQLSPGLVRQKDGILFFAFIASEMDLKNVSSERFTPIHSDLVTFGFMEFVERQERAGETYLFPELRRETGGSTYASKVLNRYLDRIGLDDPKLTVHSFRHHFKDVARNAKVPQEVHDRLTGHASPGVGSSYGAGHSLKSLSEYIEQCQFLLSGEIRQLLSANDIQNDNQ